MLVDGSWQTSNLYKEPSLDINQFSQTVSEEKIFNISANQKQELPVAAMFVDGSGRNEEIL